MEEESLLHLHAMRETIVSRLADLRLAVRLLGESPNHRIKSLLLRRTALLLLQLDLIDCKITVLSGKKITVYWTPNL